MSIIETIGEWLVGNVQPDLLELGTSTFRRLRGEWQGQRFRVTDYVEVPSSGILDLGLEQDPWIVDEAAWKEAMCKLFGGRLPRDRHVSIILPDQAFRMGVPIFGQVIMKSQPRLALEKEVHGAIPISFEQVRLVFESGQARAGKTGILFAATNENALQGLISQLFASGLLPLSIHPSFLMLGGLMKIAEPESSPHPSAWIHLGNRVTTVGVFLGGQIRRIQTVPIGGQAMTMAIQQADPCPFEEAEERKLQGPILLDDPSAEEQGTVPLYRSLEPTFVDLLQGVFGVLQAHSLEFPTEGSFRRLILSGGPGALLNFDRLVNGNLGVPVSTIGGLLGVDQAEVSFSAEQVCRLAPLLGMSLFQPWKLDRMDRLAA